MRQRANLVPTTSVTTDLTAVNLGPLTGKDIAEVAANTLRAGESLLKHWTELEPIVAELTKRAKRIVETGDPIVDTFGTLAQIAGVVEKITRASASVMKASEGLSRLTVLVMGGVPQRPDTRALSERQLANIVVEACKRMFVEKGVCPVCAPAAIEVESVPA